MESTHHLPMKAICNCCSCIYLSWRNDRRCPNCTLAYANVQNKLTELGTDSVTFKETPDEEWFYVVKRDGKYSLYNKKQYRKLPGLVGAVCFGKLDVCQKYINERK